MKENEESVDPLFTRLFLLAEIDNFTAEEKKQYYKSLEDMGDYLNIINTAAEIAEKRGHAAGLAEGMKKERYATAAKFKELGVDIAIISEATGLTIQEIEAM